MTTMYEMQLKCVDFCLSFAMFLHIFYQGHDAPVNMHPNFLQCEGASKTNHYQLILCVATELMDHTQEYKNLCNSFEELFT